MDCLLAVSDSKPKIISHLVSIGEKPTRIDSYLARQLPDLTRSQIQKLLKSKNILVNEKAVEVSYKVHPADQIIIQIPPAESLDSKPESMDLEIIYQDSEIAVINKPAELVVHAAAGHSSGTLVNALLYHLKDLSDIGGMVRPGIVHRLDKGTSGIMVIAKTNHAHVELSQQFQNRTIEKTYLALAYGYFKTESGILRSFLGRSRANRKKISSKTRHGKEAVTNYRVIHLKDLQPEKKKKKQLKGGDSSLRRNDKEEVEKKLQKIPIALLEVKPKTGRTHQIRVHLAEAGHPIVGDPLYGGKQWIQKIDPELKKMIHQFERQALHAWKLRLIHPATHKPMEFEAKIPDDLKTLLNFF